MANQCVAQTCTCPHGTPSVANPAVCPSGVLSFINPSELIDPAVGTPTSEKNLCKDKYTGAIAVGTKIYFVPHSETNIGVLDTTDDGFTQIDISSIEVGTLNEFFGGYARGGDSAVAVGTKIYMMPGSYAGIGIIDTTNDVFSTVAMKPYAGSSLLTGDDEFSSITVGPNNRRIYFGPMDCKYFVIFDTYNNGLSVAGTNGVYAQDRMTDQADKYSGSVLVGTKIYFTPFEQDDVAILDTTTNVVTFLDISSVATGRFKYFGNGAVVGTKIYFCPHGLNNIGVMDTTNDAFSIISIPEGSVPSGGATANNNHWYNKNYYGASVIGTKIYFTPAAKTDVGVLDTLNNAFTTIATPGVEAYMYAAGATVVGQRIFFTPLTIYNGGWTNKNNIGILDTTNSPPTFTTVSTAPPNPNSGDDYAMSVLVGGKLYFAPRDRGNIGAFAGCPAELCDTDNQEDCSACDVGFHLSATAAAGSAQTCVANTCTAKSDANDWAALGCVVATSQTATTVAGLGAQSPAAGYSTCAVTCPIEGQDFDVRTTNTCTCSNGTPSVDIPVACPTTNLFSTIVLPTSTECTGCTSQTATPQITGNNKFSEAITYGTKIVFVPQDATYIGILDTLATDNAFTTVGNWGGTLISHAFQGAELVDRSTSTTCQSPGFIIFTPFNVDYVGILEMPAYWHGQGPPHDGTTKTYYNLVKKSTTVGAYGRSNEVATGDEKYWGSARETRTGKYVYFAPYNELNVGAFDTILQKFELINAGGAIWNTAPHVGLTGTQKYRGMLKSFCIFFVVFFFYISFFVC
jgi:hypothetical protein